MDEQAVGLEPDKGYDAKAAEWRAKLPRVEAGESTSGGEEEPRRGTDPGGAVSSPAHADAGTKPLARPLSRTCTSVAAGGRSLARGHRGH